MPLLSRRRGPSLIRASANVVAPFGFYGAGNIGDEASLQGFARLVRGHGFDARIWIASQAPRHNAVVEPAFRYYQNQPGVRGLWARCIARFADAYIFPGGTPIMDGLGEWPLGEVVPLVLRGKRREKPVVFVGTGTESLTRSQSRRLVGDVLAENVAHWSVRSERDRQRLIAYGVPSDRITTTADMAWLIPPETAEFGSQALRALDFARQPLVGVNVNAEHALVAREPRLFEKLAMLLDYLIEARGARVLFLCNEIREDETFDRAAAARIRSHMRGGEGCITLPNEYWPPQKMMSVIALCNLTLSTRYHFCLFSALQDVPFLAIKRSDKVADLCEDLGWLYAATPGEIDLDELIQQAAALLDERVGSKALLSSRVDQMKERALGNTIALDILCEGMGRLRGAFGAATGSHGAD